MSEDRDLGLDTRITRKDFLNATLVGLGGTLLSAPAPAAWLGGVLGIPLEAAAAQDTDAWTGFGGVGDYARSNGNTKPVMDRGPSAA